MCVCDKCCTLQQLRTFSTDLKSDADVLAEVIDKMNGFVQVLYLVDLHARFFIVFLQGAASQICFGLFLFVVVLVFLVRLRLLIASVTVAALHRLCHGAV